MPKGIYKRTAYHRRRIKEGHHGVKISLESRVCECGCEKTFECRIDSKQRFILGHYNRNRYWPKEMRDRIRNTLQKPREIRNCPECGKEIDCRVGGKGKFCSHSCSAKYTWRTKDNTERCKKIGIANSCKKSDEYKKIHKERQLRMWRDPEYARNQHKAIHAIPNKPETILLELLQNLFPDEYKYVGDGSILIGFKNPDFVNINGQKKVIELFGDYWHSEGVTGVSEEQHVQERKDTFRKYGYQTLVIWEHELENTDLTKQKVLEFNKA